MLIYYIHVQHFLLSSPEYEIQHCKFTQITSSNSEFYENCLTALEPKQAIRLSAK